MERDVERKFRTEIGKLGGWALKFISPGVSGVPDRLVLLPGGKVLFAEIKAPGKKLRALQVKRKEQLEALGFDVEIVDSIQRVQEVCHEIRTTRLSRICD